MDAASVDILEAIINNMKVKDLKGGIKSCRLLQMGRKAELQDLLIHAIKDKVPIDGVVENTKNKYGRPKDWRPKKTPTNCQKKNSQRHHTGNHWYQFRKRWRIQLIHHLEVRQHMLQQ